MNAKYSQEGFGKVGVLLVVLAVIIVGSVWFFQNKKSASTLPGEEKSATVDGKGATVVTDIIEGKGDVVEVGNPVMVHYVGTLADGTVFDSSYNRGAPFIFVAGSGQVIKGWDEGIIGMRVGGKRRLEVPSSLAYGEAGAGDVIPPNSDLIFEIELLGIEGKLGLPTDESVKAIMSDSDMNTDSKKTDIADETKAEIASLGQDSFEYRGTVMDVTGLEPVRGVNTFGASSGIVYAGFSEGKYRLNAIFSFLPKPEGDDYYEGWIVRMNPPSVISTGRLEEIGSGAFSNMYLSEQDFSDHDFYVLTLEPNDGDASPGGHVLEGKLLKL